MLRFKDLCDITLYLFYALAWEGSGRVSSRSIERVRPGPISGNLHLKVVNELIEKGQVQAHKEGGSRARATAEPSYGISRSGIDRVEACLGDPESPVSAYRIHGAQLLVDRSPIRRTAEAAVHSTEQAAETASGSGVAEIPAGLATEARACIERMHKILAERTTDPEGWPEAERALLSASMGLLQTPPTGTVFLLKILLEPLCLREDPGKEIKSLLALLESGT